MGVLCRCVLCGVCVLWGGCYTGGVCAQRVCVCGVEWGGCMVVSFSVSWMILLLSSDCMGGVLGPDIDFYTIFTRHLLYLHMNYITFYSNFGYYGHIFLCGDPDSG